MNIRMISCAKIQALIDNIHDHLMYIIA